MARILILMYHIVDEPRSEREARFCCTPDKFAEQMEYLANSKYQLLTLDNIFEVTENRRSQEQTGVAVTFDDGFCDFHRNALPILTRWNIPAAMFVVSQRIGKSNDWMHKRGFPERPLLSLRKLQDVRDAGITIGSHTCSHARLSDISSNAERLDDELGASKQELEELLGQDVEHFAYPYGLYDEQTIAAVKKAGYKTACSTRSGFNRENINPLLLRRLEIYGTDKLWHFRQKLKFGVNDMSYSFPIKYYASRILHRVY